MRKRDAAFFLDLARFGIFALVSVIVTSALVGIIGGVGDGTFTEYRAVYTNASELAPGDDVRVAGVAVGRIKDVDFEGRDRAVVTFEVLEDVALTDRTEASVRYLNLIGDRYMALTEGPPGLGPIGQDTALEQVDAVAPVSAGSPLEPGATLPVDRTTPALNLTELFNGFQPLFAALRPEDVNELSLNLVRVLQGEGGTVQQLLANTASLTTNLADRDLLIGEVVTNLTTLMTTVDDRNAELNALIVSLRTWFGDLATDREVIGASLPNVADLTERVAELLSDSRPALQADIAELGRLFTVLAQPENKDRLDRTLDLLPDMLSKQTRIGVYGSWYNYYLCEFQGGIVLPSEVMNLLTPEIQKNLSEFTLVSRADRCQ
ncbi:virulence factor Mce family protein [Aeromicrobium marinum DSM 15272]|uniref:Virulence factor Mce family protein n=1 Tax=Aeromicrobium marinum DSM 15272 TaxID=585531 RepID=E2SEJ9_9ACTN|nr:MCE family protein [Aeromicrobium marinum]EFQ82296.1 virulence factor Mce family protein [Aeromicrobium marinum DSM 15272]